MLKGQYLHRTSSVESLEIESMPSMPCYIAVLTSNDGCCTVSSCGMSSIRIACKTSPAASGTVCL